MNPEPDPAHLVAGDDSESLYEVIDGERVEKPPLSANAVNLASLLVILVGGFARAHRVGRVVSEGLFRFPLGRRHRDGRPDVAFVSFDRWPADRPPPIGAPWPVVPDLAIEVLSPSILYREVTAKIREYFRAGVRLVWVVDPEAHQVSVFTAPREVQILAAPGELTGDPVLPELRLSLAELFADTPPPPDEDGDESAQEPSP
jgi:Uma2 family endonuclease